MQALNAGDTLTDSFTVTTVDGTSQVVTITITGANDAAVISGDIDRGRCSRPAASPTARPAYPTATGDLDAADVDNPTEPGRRSARRHRATNGYGTYTLTAAGVWTYTLDDNNAAVQALNVGDTLTDTFTATTVGGTTQLVTITINGANDAAVDQRRHDRRA